MMTPSNHDLRAFLSEVDKIGELRRIENIPWDKDLGGLVEMILERSAHPPAMLFEKIPGARQDTEVLCSQIDTLPRLAIAMGTDPKLGLTDFIQAWRRKIRNFEPVPAQFIKDAPILENRVDKNIDLEAFPIPRWHEEDGGRYIGTDDLVVTEDPEEHWINAGTYRVMLQGKDAVFVFFQIGFLMSREVNRLLFGEAVLLRQGSKPQRGPVADGLFGEHGEPPFGDGTFPHKLAFEVEDGAALGQHRLAQNFIFAEAECFGGLEHNQHMPGRFWMNEFIGDLDAEGAHQVGMALKEADMLVIGDRDQGVDLDGEVAPVLEKQLDRRERQFAFEKRAHERAVGNTFLPAPNDFLV